MTITVTISPDPKDIKLYKGRLIEATVTVTDDTNPIKEGTTVTLTTAPNNTVDFPDVSTDVVVTTTAGDPKKATAVFYFSPREKINDLTITAKYNINEVDSVTGSNTYTVLASAIVKISVLNKEYIPAASSDTGLPNDPIHTANFSVQVFDPDDYSPVLGYLVDLRQQYPIGLFFKKVRFFYDLKQKEPEKGLDGKPGIGSFLRTETDAQGQVTYYIVSTTATLLCQFHLLVDRTLEHPIGSLLIANLDLRNANFSAPQLDLSINSTGAYLLDSVAGPLVNVRIPPARSLSSGTAAYGFINNKLAFRADCTEDNQFNLVTKMGKAFIYSDYGKFARQTNEFGYVVTSEVGDIATTSAFLEFTAVGGNNSNQPGDASRDVPAPVIPDSENYINSTILDNSTVNLRVKLTPTSMWIPKSGEGLAATIYLNGYYSGTNQPKQDFKTPDTLFISTGDILQGYADILLDSSIFIGYDSSYSSPSKTGIFYAEYNVIKSKDDNSILHVSNVYRAQLDTVPPGAILEKKEGENN